MQMNMDNNIVTIILCPKCGGKTWKYGKIPSRQGMIQKYKCLNCAYTFTRTKTDAEGKTA